MDEFEYQAVNSPNTATKEQLVDWLNHHGLEGWELVTFNYGSAIFKRRRTER